MEHLITVIMRAGFLLGPNQKATGGLDQRCVFACFRYVFHSVCCLVCPKCFMAHVFLRFALSFPTRVGFALANCSLLLDSVFLAERKTSGENGAVIVVVPNAS